MPQKALIVEDEPELAELFGDILRLRGMESHVLHHGKPAPQYIREHRPERLRPGIEWASLSM